MPENTDKKNSKYGHILGSVDRAFVKGFPSAASFFCATNVFKKSTRKDEGNYKRVHRNFKSKRIRTKLSILQNI